MLDAIIGDMAGAIAEAYYQKDRLSVARKAVIKMSYAIQCLQENIIGAGGYVSEINAYERLKCSQDIIFEAFNELIFKGLLSKEFYENKGHKVLGRFVANTNEFEINPEVKNDDYKHAFLLEFKNVIYDEKGEKHIFNALSQVFVGSKESAKKQARKLKEILSIEQDFLIVRYRVKEKS